MMKKNFIILGNTSYLGKNLQKFLLKKKLLCIGFGSKQINLLNIKSTMKLKKYINDNSVIFFLSFNKNQATASNKDFENNFNLIKNFTLAIKNKKPKKILFFSSQVIYGENTDNQNTSENTLPDPTSFYGIAKYTAERLLIKFCAEEKISLTILRIPRVYGLNDNPKNYGPTKFTNLAKIKKPIEIWGDGDEKRDYIFIDDLNEILLKISRNKFKGIINLSSGTSISFIKIIRLIESILKLKIKIIKKKRSREKVDHIMKNKLLIKTIGNFKFTPIKKGLSVLLKN